MYLNKNCGLSVFVAIAGFIISSPVRATSINVTVDQDTHIAPRADVAGDNFGNADRAIVGGTTASSDFQVPLFHWSLASVPAGEVATTNGTATFTVRSNTFTSSDNVAIYKINSANAGWIQGNGGAGAGAAGEPTWNSKAQPTAWTGGPGSGNNAGGAGYDAAFQTINNTAVGTQLVVTIPQSILNDWISNPAGNAGILMRQLTMDATERLLQLWSLESGDQVNRPAATLSFTTAPVSTPEPSALVLLCIGIVGSVVVRRRRHR